MAVRRTVLRENHTAKQKVPKGDRRMEKNEKHIKIRKLIKNSVIALIAAVVVFGAGYLTGRSHTVEPEKAVEVRQENPGIQLPGETEKAVITVEQVEAKILEIGGTDILRGGLHCKKRQGLYQIYIYRCTHSRNNKPC